MQPPRPGDDIARLESLIREDERADTRTHAPRPAVFARLEAPLVDGYENLSLLSAGGQGIVYKAQQVSTKRTVALKLIIEPFPSEEQLRRFEREIECVARLRHPNIVTIYECRLTDDGRPYYSMEFVEGQALDDFVRATDPTVEDRLRLFAKVCDAIDCAHREDIVHRDLKPSNIRVDEAGEPRVLDFGLARRTVPERTAATAQMTQSGEFLGTLAYAAPEQFDGEPDHVTQLTDVWALGVLLYQLLTGEAPFKSTGSLARIENQIREETPPKPSSIRRGLDADVDTIVLRALAKEPGRRYLSAGALAADVHRYLAGEPIEARRDSLSYRIRKRLIRQRVPVALALVITLLTASVTYYFVQSALTASAALKLSARMHYNNARVVSLSQPDEALGYLADALRDDPSLTDAKLLEGLILWRTRQTDTAVDVLTEIVEANPNDSRPHVLLARILEPRDPERAAYHHQRVDSTARANLYYRALLEDDEAAIALLTQHMHEEGLEFDALLERAIRFQRLRRFEEMLGDADRLIELAPKVASSWSIRGLALSRLNRPREAINCFDKAVSIEPSASMTLTFRATARSAAGNHRGAIEDCTEAINHNPDIGAPYAVRAFARLSLESSPDIGGARADVARALELNPKLASAWYCEGRLAKLEEDFDAAVMAFTRALELDPYSNASLLDRADVRISIRALDDAIKDASLALELYPENAAAFNLRGCAYELLGDFANAGEDLDHAIDLDPRNARYIYNRGRLRRLVGHFGAAVEDFTASSALRPRESLPYVGRALAYRFLGDFDSARADLSKAIEFARAEDAAILHAILWEWLMLAGDTTGAARALRTADSINETPEWTRYIVSFLGGSLSENQLLAHSNSSEQELEASYYIGARHLISGDRAAAVKWFTRCTSISDLNCDEYELARWHLAQIRTDRADGAE